MWTLRLPSGQNNLSMTKESFTLGKYKEGLINEEICCITLKSMSKTMYPIPPKVWGKKWSTKHRYTTNMEWEGKGIIWIFWLDLEKFTWFEEAKAAAWQFFHKYQWHLSRYKVSWLHTKN